jgi:hypothetical protein
MAVQNPEVSDTRDDAMCSEAGKKNRFGDRGLLKPTEYLPKS